MDKPKGCDLTVERETDAGAYTSDVNCDGCGAIISADRMRVTDIDSCCGGGCVRTLCMPCVLWAASELASKA